MTKIVADDLQDDEVSSLSEYLASVSTSQIGRHKKTIEVTGLTNTKIRFLLKKFLYSRHLPEFGVLDAAGNFEIVQLKPEEKEPDRQETLSPTLDLRLPLVIPHWVQPQPSGMIEWEGEPPPTRTRYKKK